MAAPPVPKPADYFALTRILLVPSVWEEPFGRVAAEAMINGDSADRQQPRRRCRTLSAAISRDGGGGRVLPIPEWMTSRRRAFPSEQEVEPWYEAVCALWDDAALYEAVGGESASDRRRALQRRRFAQAACGLLHVAQTRRSSDPKSGFF